MPAHYAAMVANGRSRGAAFSVEAIKAQWRCFPLFRVMPERATWMAQRHGVEARIPQLGSLLTRQKFASKRLKRFVQKELQQAPDILTAERETQLRGMKKLRCNGSASILRFYSPERRDRATCRNRPACRFTHASIDHQVRSMRAFERSSAPDVSLAGVPRGPRLRHA
jgi:hypothetical protein